MLVPVISLYEIINEVHWHTSYSFDILILWANTESSSAERGVAVLHYATYTCGKRVGTSTMASLLEINKIAQGDVTTLVFKS